MRKILFVTGIRSEYDILYSVMRAVEKSPALELRLVVTGAHLAPMYGSTVREIEKDGFPITARIQSLLNSDRPSARAKSAAIQLASLVDVISGEKPHFLVAPMDREEAVTVALAGAYMRIPVAHLGGGDTAEDGNVDNPIRHAVTKLAHLHLVSTERSAQRVIQMGEEAWRVHAVGDPGLDRLCTTPDMSPEELWKAMGCRPVEGPYAVVIQHSILTDPENAGRRMQQTLDSLVALGIPAFIGHPNSDAGGQQILQVISSCASAHPELLHAYGNLPREVFVNLMRRAHVLVGNSSCGIVEAPFLGLPVVNVGARQRGREHADNVQFVDHDSAQIRAAIERAVRDAEYRRKVKSCVNPYGDGRSGERIARILSDQAIDDRLLNKLNTF
jgi:GDP/UDP-N,N'-diacetylbacillosamine 2-epimerase (hydrolysing)